VSSAGYPPFVELALEKLGLRSCFNEVITSAGEGLYKSGPAIFLRACQRLGIRPEEAVHIGDHARYDVRAAQDAGLFAVWIPVHARRTAEFHGRDWQDLERVGSQADAVISSLSELPSVVAGLDADPTTGAGASA
jgi:FMN phosphatase YigB (HAD superfamily)